MNTYSTFMHLEFVDGDPGVGWKIEQHRHEELETPVPVTDQEHHNDQIQYFHEQSGYTQKLTRHHTSAGASIPQQP